jgi:hypothetical protein
MERKGRQTLYVVYCTPNPRTKQTRLGRSCHLLAFLALRSLFIKSTFIYAPYMQNVARVIKLFENYGINN